MPCPWLAHTLGWNILTYVHTCPWLAHIPIITHTQFMCSSECHYNGFRNTESIMVFIALKFLQEVEIWYWKLHCTVKMYCVVTSLWGISVLPIFLVCTHSCYSWGLVNTLFQVSAHYWQAHTHHTFWLVHTPNHRKLVIGVAWSNFGFYAMFTHKWHHLAGVLYSWVTVWWSIVSLLPLNLWIPFIIL
jgi:hypothetical protein